jgi:vacuolar protein sorting-associated protein 1
MRLTLGQAMSIVTERLNANKPVDKGKPNAAINNNKDLDVDVKKEEPSFFGSFFSAAKNAPKKKGAAIMDSVSTR